MKIIPKLQTAWQPLQVDNTRVQKPMVMQPIKRTLKPGEMLLNLGGQQTVVTPKQTYIQQDNRSDKQRKSDQKYAQQKRKQIELDKAQKRTGEVASAFLERTMPSYWAQQLTNESLNPIQQFLIDGFSPGKVIKGGLTTAAILTAPIRGLSKTKFGTHIVEEGGKKLIAERVHPEWFSGISPELQKEAETFLKEGLTKRPILYEEVKNNPELMQFVKDIAEGKNQEILARFNETKVAPNLGSLIALKQTGLPQTKHVVIGQKGHSPIIGDWHNTKNMGNYNYFAGGENAKWAAAQYADVGTFEQAHNLLISRGFTPGSKQYETAMEEFSKIMDMQKAKGVKRFAYKEGAKDRSGGAKNFSWEHLITKGPTKKKIEWTPEERDNYLDALKNWTNFWGKDIESGGSRQVIARADSPLGFATIEANGRNYKELGGSYIEMPGISRPNKIDVNTDANKLGKQLEKLKIPLFRVSEVDDPIRINTHGSYGLPSTNTWFFQHKKGGKLNENNRRNALGMFKRI